MKKIIATTVLTLSVTASSLLAFSLNDAANMANAATTQTNSSKQVTSNELVNLLSKQLGVSDKQAAGGVGSILSYAQKALPSNDYKELSSAIPDASSLLALAPQASSAVSSLSGLAGNAASTEGLATLASQFGALGLSANMVSKFVPVIMDYFKGNGSTSAMKVLASLFSN
jgi:hypothetical protein